MAKAVKRRAVTRARVLEAAFELVEREGLEALSMRRVGEQLGVEAMSLYNHVEDKAALLDGLHEQVLSRLPVPPARRTAWKAALAERATALRRLLLKHPRFLSLFVSRPAVTPASLAHVESVLQVLHDAGFGPRESLNALQSIVAFVVGHAMATAAPSDAAPRYAQLDAGQFPRVREMSTRLARHDSEAEFAFGLSCFLEGLASRRPAQ